MAFSRYTRDRTTRGGTTVASTATVRVIRNAISQGRISTTTRTLQGSERLDTLAGKIYGDAKLWWILAAASNIGWGLQIPPGTQIVIPDLSQIRALVG